MSSVQLSRSFTRTRSLVTAALALAAAACGDDGHDHDHDHTDAAPTPDADVTPDAPQAASLTISHAHLVAGAPVTMGTSTPYANAAGDAFGVTVLRYFVSDLVLTYTDDTQHAVPGAHYVDHDLAGTVSRQLDGVPPGDLASVRFVMGLTPALNVTGAFTAPPESLMEWPAMMGGGYHYMKFEGRYINEAGDPFAYRCHSGALAGTDYSFEVVLDATGHTIGTSGATLSIEMNLEEWFTGPNVWDLDDYFNASHPGIMGDAAAQRSLQENGAGVFTLGAP
ncbi:MAG: hypothetical protein K8M05_37170 [Deltaproteobacteria bacterium]|nr:hypothetical protein [Kofleriaceae bacterium]